MAGTVKKSTVAFGQNVIGHTQGLNIGAVHPAALEADKVQPVKFSTGSLHKTVGDHVIGDHRDCPDDRPTPHANPLMDARQTTNDDIVANLAMTCNGDVIGQDDPVAQFRVVPDMGSCHKQAIVTHLSNSTATFGSGVQRGCLANAAACADDQTRALTFVFQVLRDLSHSGVGEYYGILTDLSPPCDNRV